VVLVVVIITAHLLDTAEVRHLVADDSQADEVVEVDDEDDGNYFLFLNLS
jgi:hypothetical protein